MTTPRKLALLSTALLAAASGLAYAAMKYLLPRDDPFSAFGHPWQPHALKVHILAAPLLLFVVGWLYGAHAQPQLREGGAAGRRSGRSILALTLVMALSGYVVQAFAEASWRPAAAWIHGAAGTLFLLSLGGHLGAARRVRRRAQAAPAAGRPAYLRPLRFPGTPRAAAPAVSRTDSCSACPGCGIPRIAGVPAGGAGPEGNQVRHNRT